MSIVINRKPIRTSGNHPVECTVKTDYRLFRQPVNEVDADRFETVGTSGINHAQCFFFRLNAVDRLLYCGVKILNTDAHTVETKLAEQLDGFRTNLARIDFD